jgi:hypothetical protein
VSKTVERSRSLPPAPYLGEVVRSLSDVAKRDGPLHRSKLQIMLAHRPKTKKNKKEETLMIPTKDLVIKKQK